MRVKKILFAIVFLSIFGVTFWQCPPWLLTDDSRRPTISVEWIPQDGPGNEYTYTDSTRTFSVTVNFKPGFALVNNNEPWTSFNWFTRDPILVKIVKPTTSYGMTYTATAKDSLTIQVGEGVVDYASLGSSTCNNTASEQVVIIYKEEGTWTNTNPQPTGNTAWWWTCSTGTSAAEHAKKWEECLGWQRICVPKPGVCCGIKLNTTVPFIGKCISMVSSGDEKILKANNKRNVSDTTLQVTENTAFPRLMLWLTKILVTVILLASFLAIIVAGVMMAASGAKEEWYSQWTKIIGSVIAALALLGASGVILRLINPNFFG